MKTYFCYYSQQQNKQNQQQNISAPVLQWQVKLQSGNDQNVGPTSLSSLQFKSHSHAK